jgi:hypothetical protein
MPTAGAAAAFESASYERSPVSVFCLYQFFCFWQWQRCRLLSAVFLFALFEEPVSVQTRCQSGFERRGMLPFVLRS